MDNIKVTGILSHIWDISSQIWRLWTHTTTSLLPLHLPPSTSPLVIYSLQYGEHFPLLLFEWRPPTMTTLVKTSYFLGEASYPHPFNNYLQLSFDHLPISSFWWFPSFPSLPLSSLKRQPYLQTLHMTIFHSLYTGNHLLLPTLWWLYPTPTTPPPIGRLQQFPHPLLHLTILL